MQKHEIIINLAMLTLLMVAVVVFLIKVFPERQSRPERWHKGLWFIFGFLLSPFTSIFALVAVPVMLILALFTAFFRSPRARKMFYFALGAAAGATLFVVWLGLLNTFAVRQR